MRRLFSTLSRLVADVAKRLRSARLEPPPPATPSTAPRPRAARKPPYDLAKDASTDTQKYLM